MVGVIVKFTPLPLVPNRLPPVSAVYQLITLPEEVAFKFVVALPHIVEGVAVTILGIAGKADTVIVFVTVLLHEFELV